ncbi:MAG: cell division protein ZipA [Gammaproteobacteria bacterium]|jgi:cell division protein ZipA
MDNIRWILLATGALIIVGIYLFSRWQSRRNAADGFVQHPPAEHAADRDFDPLFDEPADASYVDAELHRLDRLISEDTEPPVGDRGQPVADTGPAYLAPEKVITLYVLAPTGVPFRGDFLLEALGEAGLEFGDMQIFHRIERQARREQTLFSLANLVEPGTFDPRDMKRFTTQGVVLFLQLPGPDDAIKAFDAMVAAARTLAASLEGSLCDATRSVLTNQTISHMREEVVDYQLRQRVTKTAS